MMKYYKKNNSKALKRYIGSLLSVFFQEKKNILKFLKLEDKSISLKDFFYFYKSQTQEDGASTPGRNFFLRSIF